MKYESWYDLVDELNCLIIVYDGGGDVGLGIHVLQQKYEGQTTQRR